MPEADRGVHEQEGQTRHLTDRGQREEDDQRNDADRGREKGHVADPSHRSGQGAADLALLGHVVADVGRGEKCGVDRGGGCQQRSNGNGDEADSACSGLTGVGQQVSDRIGVLGQVEQHHHCRRDHHIDHSDDRQGGVQSPRQVVLGIDHVPAGGRGHAEALVGHVEQRGCREDPEGPAGCCLADPVGLNMGHREGEEPHKHDHLDPDDRGLRSAHQLGADQVYRGEDDHHPDAHDPAQFLAAVVGQGGDVLGETSGVQGSRDDVGRVLEHVQAACDKALPERVPQVDRSTSAAGIGRAEFGVRVDG